MPRPSAIERTESFIALEVNDGGVAVKRERTGAGDLHVQELPAMSPAAVEEDDFVAARAAGHACRVFLARAFNEDLNLTTDERFVLPSANFVHEFEETRVAFLDALLGKLIRHRGGRRVFALRILEKIRVVELDFAAKRKRFREVCL